MVRGAFEELGPSFVKLGQILSVRPDIVPPAYIAEFTELQSNVGPVGYEDVRRIVTAALGSPPEELFSAFETEPLAAGSIAQVHRAVLADGDVVAVKVQRSGVGPMIAQDVRLMRSVADLAERFAALRNYQPVKLVEEFADWTSRELDFRVEGHNADHFRVDFADDPAVYVPTIHWAYTTREVLTMEYVEGASVEDPEALDRIGTDRAELARRGVRTLLKQVFVDHFFHGDPHPGNMFVLPGEVVCYHDFGIVGRLSGDTARELTSFLIAFSLKDVDSAVRHISHLAVRLPGGEPQRMVGALRDLVGAWVYTGRQNVARTFQQILVSAAGSGMSFPTELALLGKALITVETVGFDLDPAFDMDAELRRFVPELLREMVAPSRLAGAFVSGALDYAHWLSTAPERVSLVLDAVSGGRVSVGVDRDEFHELLAEMRRDTLIRVLAWVIAILVATFIAASVFPAASAVAGSARTPVVVAAGALGLWLFVLLSRRI